MNLHRFYAASQIEYCGNFIFTRHFPIHRIFRTLLRDWVVPVHRAQDQRDLGVRVSKKLKETQRHAVAVRVRASFFQVYCKHAFVKQYEKFSTFLRNEIPPIMCPIQSAEEIGAPGRRAREVPGDHRPLRHPPAAVL
jgi:hypothetical protein